MNNYKIVYAIEAINSNPNGDPDNGNRPRTDSDGYGYITSVCLKHKVRQYIDEVHGNTSGNEVWIIGDESGTTSMNSKKKAGMTRDDMKKKFWDVRMFGGVLGTGDTKGEKSVRGCAQFTTIAKSIEPVNIVEETITKCIATKDNTGVMGSRSYVEYGLYVGAVDVIGSLAEKNGVTDEDVEMLVEAIKGMFDYDKAAARPEMYIKDVAVLKYDGMFRNINYRDFLQISGNDVKIVFPEI